MKTADGKFEEGDRVTLRLYSDREVYTVTYIDAKGKRMNIQRCKVRLLNGVNSGEPDAMKCYPGGFCAHFEGAQRWEILDDSMGESLIAKLMKNGKWMTVMGEIVSGGVEFRDFNF